VDGWKSFAATIDTWERFWQEHKLFSGQKHVKETYVLKDLVEITGAGRRTIQFWADHGVLVADKGTDHAGTGKQRRFSRNEAIIACLVHAFAKRQIGLGELIGISKVMRNQTLKDPEVREIINQAISDENSIEALIYETWNEKGRQRHQLTLVGDWIGAALTPDFPTFLDSLTKPDGFASIIRLRTYLSRMKE
jgi:hypothetical protein